MKTAVETAVRSFLVNGYFLGFIEVNRDETFKFCDAVAQASQQQIQNCLDPRAANKSSRCPKKWFEKCSKNPLRLSFRQYLWQWKRREREVIARIKFNFFFVLDKRFFYALNCIWKFNFHFISAKEALDRRHIHIFPEKTLSRCLRHFLSFS